jgi:membrane-bound ClpP family serine protease
VETIYLVLFIVGIIYAVITIFLGDVFHLDIGGGELPFLSPTTIGSFVTVFGGTGYVLSVNTHWHSILIAAIAIILALILATLMFVFVMLPLYRSEKSAAKSDKEMVGKTAEVVTSIMEGAKGEIIYEQGGMRLSAPAQAVNGQILKQGEMVLIMDVVSGTFVVEKIGY